MYYKVISNNMVVDLLTELKFVRQLPNSTRCILTDKYSANGIVGSDNNIIYHLQNTDDTFSEGTTTVTYEVISEDTYRALAATAAQSKQQNIELQNRVSSLEELVEKQNTLLETLLAKLS